jgi:type IV pilus assembly protein PilQ
MNVKFFLLSFFLSLFVKFSWADTKGQDTLALDLQNVNTQDALHILAKFLHQNILLSPTISGTTSLYLHGMNKQDAFNLVLTTHDLTKKKVGNAWFIAPRTELLHQMEMDSKQQTMQEENSPLQTRIWQIHYAKADDLAKLMQENGSSLLSKRGHVRVDLRTNTLCIQDTFQHLAEIKQVIARLDVPVQQILIEARLISIDQDFERKLGIQFSVKDPTAEGGNLAHYSLAVARVMHGRELDVELAALESDGHAEIISTPSLFTGNQQPAFIESGEEIPYQEVSESGGTAVAFKKAVLSLKVTPQILPNNKVLLQLQVNQDRPSSRVVLGVPSINTRQISTHIEVIHGQTIVLGGIYEASQDHALQRTPFLGKIPLVGWLFKQENVKENKRELLIFVTPKIISSNK